MSVIGRPSILIPLAAAIRDEQTANGRGLVDANAAVMIPESQLSPDVLTTHIHAILDQPDAALQMSLAAMSVGKPEAAEALAQMVETLAEKGNRK